MILELAERRPRPPALAVAIADLTSAVLISLQPMYEPVDALQSPRYSGPRTFGRLPHVETTDGVDVALFGIPWDSRDVVPPRRALRARGRALGLGAAAALQPGAGRDGLGRALVRRLRRRARPCRATSRTRSARIQAYAEAIHRGGAIPLGIGGDHSVTLAELRAAAAVHGPLGLVHLDAHHDVWDSYFGRPYNHGTVFKRACEEGLLDPARCVQAGHARLALRAGATTTSRASSA